MCFSFLISWIRSRELGFLRVHGEVRFFNETKADGIRVDGSFGQHQGILYNGNYGKD